MNSIFQTKTQANVFPSESTTGLSWSIVSARQTTTAVAAMAHDRQQQFFHHLSLVSGVSFLLFFLSVLFVVIYVPPIESPLFGLPPACVLVVSYLRMYSVCDTAPPSSCEKAYPPCISKSSETPLPPPAPAAVADVPGRLPDL